MAACAWGIPVVNAMTHIGSAIAHGAYNPGVFTSVVLFVPLSLVLLGSLVLRMRGLPYFAFFGVNVVNGLWPLVLGRRSHILGE